MVTFPYWWSRILSYFHIETGYYNHTHVETNPRVVVPHEFLLQCALANLITIYIHPLHAYIHAYSKLLCILNAKFLVFFSLNISFIFSFSDRSNHTLGVFLSSIFISFHNGIWSVWLLYVCRVRVARALTAESPVPSLKWRPRGPSVIPAINIGGT